jgi:hypothetical protein
MTEEELLSKINQFVEIAEKLPERYREKCFEVLLSGFLRTGGSSEKPPENAAPATSESGKKFIIPIGVRATLQQYNVPEDTLEKIFLMDGNEISPKYKIKTTKKSDAQVQVALLTALENALKPNGKFEFATETVRTKCQDLGVYDGGNFTTHFRNNSRFFKSLSDKEHVELSPEGKQELAETMLAISK